MKKLFYILVLFTGIANAQIVNIPDANFKAKLIALGIDTNADGNIQVIEANAVTILDVSSSNISDLTGISSFSNLETLVCYSNSLTSIDVSSLTSLKTLDISGNNFTSLDLSMMTNLENLYCYVNHSLTSLNVSGITTLKVLLVGDCHLSSLNLNGLPNLMHLECQSGQFTSLDVSSCSNLQYLDCNFNQLTSLNVSNLSNLVHLECYLNQLNTIDLSGLTNLTYLDLNSNNLSALDLSDLNNLSFLDCKNNTPLTTLNCSSNPITQLNCSYNAQLQTLFVKNGVNWTNPAGQNNFLLGCQGLSFICIDESEAAIVNDAITLAGLTNVVVNSYCTFTPGGNYNTISGTATFDADNNGCDAGDSGFTNFRLNINDTTISSGASFTDYAGYYSFYTQAGSFVITPNIENQTWFNISPTTVTIPFADNDNNTVSQNFCVAPNGIHPDVEIVIAPILRARPGFDAVYQVVYKNKGNITLSGNLTFAYDDAVQDFVSSTVSPISQSTGMLNYNYTNLIPFENRSFYITLHANAPTDSPAVNIGDQLNFTATITPGEGDEFISDNTFQFNQTVVGSFDPNDITCIEGNMVSPSEIGNYLHYIINFENTGTADAENIVVRDVIDTTQFDVNSLQLLNSSAPVTARLTGNVAEFIFQNINLHSGGHGNILIKIKSKNTLVQGDSVNKRANIYFDYNAPVDTNLENTTFQALSNTDYETDASISVYPNPTNGNVNINCNNTIKSIQLFDVQGRLLQTDLVNQTSTVIDISNKSKGVYFLKIISDKGIGVEKIVRE